MGCNQSDTSYTGGRSLRLIMAGLDGSGKTTILYQLLHRNFFTTTQTLGFNVETIQHRGDELTVWDMGGHKSIRGLWKHYLFQAQGIIFVVDSSSRERLPEARDVLQTLLRHRELDHVPVVILANKRDKPDVLTERALLDGLGLYDVTGRLCTIQCTCAVTGDGLMKAIDNIVNFSKRAQENSASKSA
ncbi:ADP-ribosylation factor-like [Mizuhopecten yessoensis]|uniref:ADP-ribosylation factor-like protein 6 n=1 Tax=Mizuhopecten yessoensis TaxID=6573 RepID=A0A210QL33_MIZYE|nr:ADP-ribosylation factor-like [Mizuhopecten yessoensis]OWF49435.1 ADP-ribosylation factor [Mizuhopecten yessoensis]